MRITIIKDAMITIPAGQTVEAKDDDAKRAIKLGLAEPVKEKAKKGAGK
jgi:hypothetical protein